MLARLSKTSAVSIRDFIFTQEAVLAIQGAVELADGGVVDTGHLLLGFVESRLDPVGRTFRVMGVTSSEVRGLMKPPGGPHEFSGELLAVFKDATKRRVELDPRPVDAGDLGFALIRGCRVCQSLCLTDSLFDSHLSIIEECPLEDWPDKITEEPREEELSQFFDILGEAIVPLSQRFRKGSDHTEARHRFADSCEELVECLGLSGESRSWHRTPGLDLDLCLLEGVWLGTSVLHPAGLPQLPSECFQLAREFEDSAIALHDLLLLDRGPREWG